jgi:hypothetical protein
VLTHECINNQIRVLYLRKTGLGLNTGKAFEAVNVKPVHWFTVSRDCNRIVGLCRLT